MSAEKSPPVATRPAPAPRERAASPVRWSCSCTSARRSRICCSIRVSESSTISFNKVIRSGPSLFSRFLVVKVESRFLDGRRRGLVLRAARDPVAQPFRSWVVPPDFLVVLRAFIAPPFFAAEVFLAAVPPAFLVVDFDFEDLVERADRFVPDSDSRRSVTGLRAFWAPFTTFFVPDFTPF